MFPDPLYCLACVSLIQLLTTFTKVMGDPAEFERLKKDAPVSWSFSSQGGDDKADWWKEPEEPIVTLPKQKSSRPPGGRLPASARAGPVETCDGPHAVRTRMSAWTQIPDAVQILDSISKRLAPKWSLLTAPIGNNWSPGFTTVESRCIIGVCQFIFLTVRNIERCSGSRKSGFWRRLS
jgi:hypothetical protein